MDPSAYEPRHLDWPDLVNVRDLGGLPLRDGAVRAGALIRADSLTSLADGSAELLREAGVSRIVDLRRPGESPEPHPFADDAAYVNVPVEDPADPAQLTSTMAELYLTMLDDRPQLFAAAVAAVADAPPGAVVVHCAGGKDRTGLVTALALTVAGAEPEVVAADYALTEGRLAARLEHYLADVDEGERDAIRALTATPAESMLGVLRHLDERYGGAEPYLRTGGVTDDQLAALRARLRAD